MGQYYNAVTKDKNGVVTIYDLQVKGEDFNGYKLMEHSWWANSFCKFISSKIKDNPMNIAWIGDYAEPDEIKASGFPEDVTQGNEKSGKPVTFELDSVEYLVNHTSKEYVLLKKYKKLSNNGRWIIYPISLLTAIGNGRGGGDYHHENPNYDMVGGWAGDLIELTNDKNKIEGYSELDVYFKE